MFTTPFKLPVSQKTVRYNDFTNAMLFDVARCVAANDHQQIEQCMNQIIESMTGEQVHDMCGVDKFCLLLDMRSMFLGDQLELQNTNSAKIKIKISTMLDNLIKCLSNMPPPAIINVGDVMIEIGLPDSMCVEDYDKLVEQSIINIHTDGQTHAFHQFTPVDRETFVDSLPAETLMLITNHIKHVQTSMDGLHLIPHNSAMGIDGVKIGVYDNSMIEIIKSLFAEDLMNFYEMQFSLITKMRVTYDHFMKMTPNESKIYVNLYNKDIKKQEEAMNKQNQPHAHSRGVGGI